MRRGSQTEQRPAVDARHARRIASARRGVWIAGLFQLTFGVVFYGWMYGFVFVKQQKIVYAAVVTVLLVAVNGAMIARRLRQAKLMPPPQGPLSLTHL